MMCARETTGMDSEIDGMGLLHDSNRHHTKWGSSHRKSWALGRGCLKKQILPRAFLGEQVCGADKFGNLFVLRLPSSVSPQRGWQKEKER